MEMTDKNKLKVVLSCVDILKFENGISELFGETVDHSLLQCILREAKEKFNFSVDNYKILIESVPSKSDGYIVFISKIEKEDEMLFTDCTIVSFYDYEALKSGIIAVDDWYSGSSTLYELNQKYYLVLDSAKKENFEKVKTFLCDFGDIENDSGLFFFVLKEYGQLLFQKNAIKSIKNQTK